MNKNLLFYIFLILILSSCSTSGTKGSFIRLLSNTNTQTSYDEEKAAKIKVFYQKSPDFEFVEIGIIEAMAYGKDVGLKDLFPELKKQAFLAGGEAIHKIQINRHNQTGEILHATAVVIVKK